MKKYLLCFFTLLLLHENIFAANSDLTNNDDQKKQNQDEAQYQKVIEEYKNHLAKVPAEIRDEIVSYRKQVALLNQQKRNLYKKLSQEAQQYLATERLYKQKLPFKKQPDPQKQEKSK